MNRPVLLYDGHCAFCVRWVQRIRHLDRHHRIQYVASQRRSELAGLPALPGEALDRAMHLILPDGTVLKGGEAVPEIVRLLPAVAFLRLPLSLPVVQRLVNHGYDWVAERRHRFGCASGACGV